MAPERGVKFFCCCNSCGSLVSIFVRYCSIFVDKFDSRLATEVKDAYNVSGTCV